MIPRMTAILRTLVLVLAPLIASAQGAVPAADAKAVRAVIEAQLDAFRRDDAARAFALATPGIRETFRSAENFLAMVRASYAAVYRPKSVLFEMPQLIDGQLLQPVRLTDAEGRAWIAIYPMQRQPDGSWRTDGCQLARLAGTET
jgi:hypothetical protein